ncbi:hypothetical protein [Streptomyces silvisoli]|uniref:Uncharacterized protein n=1 Tax=Streptomyces silvisoli TaxID=3034235 RepID=A0ABT5ZUC6_9ACTN|nr:hypothetical protein [Streptomyces silvisoli]MDF3293416.1 hypothetical protein [Streptomyces silvisoli]
MTTNVPSTGKGKKPGVGIDTGANSGEFPEPTAGIELQPLSEGVEEQAQEERPIINNPDNWSNTLR